MKNTYAITYIGTKGFKNFMKKIFKKRINNENANLNNIFMEKTKCQLHCQKNISI